MRASLFWFSDEKWAKIEALVPTNRPGPKPHNNRRILSGIMHVLKVGCRWQDCPPEYGPYTTVYNRFNRWSGRGIWQQIFETAAGLPEPPDDVALDSTHAKAHRCAGGGEGGALEQAIGVTRGGRNSKLHALVDKLCRPWVLILTPGNTADCTVGPQCVSLVAGIRKLLGDKAYDSDSFRKSLKEDGITPVIPGRANRKKPIRHDKEAYKGRNVIERCFCRLKDFRRIATRYDKLARNYFSSAVGVRAGVMAVRNKARCSKAVRIPGNVVIDEDVAELQVDAFASGFGGDKDLNAALDAGDMPLPSTCRATAPGQCRWGDRPRGPRTQKTR